MKYHDFIINYTLKDKSGNVIEKKKVRAKKKMSKFEAMASFEEYLKKKHPDFGSLVVHSCEHDNPLTDLLSGRNPFGGFGPFGF